MTAELPGVATPRCTHTSVTTSCRHSTTNPRATPSHEWPSLMSAAHNIALLVNPTAGKGRAARVVAEVTERMRAGGANVAILVGTDAADAQQLARTAIDDGVDALVALGGGGAGPPPPHNPAGAPPPPPPPPAR